MHRTVTLHDVNRVCDELWNMDSNRLSIGKDVRIHLEGLKRSINDRSDRCNAPFFTAVDEHNLRSRPTFAAFMALLDNYEPACGRAETVTADERQEEVNFLRAIGDTQPIQHVFEFLKSHGKVPDDFRMFKGHLGKLWFQLYRRTAGGPLDSSGFEHVFVGEVKNGEVSGCHNWLQIYNEEKKGTLNYKGFFLGRSRHGSGHQIKDPHVVTLQFDWHGVEKKVGSTLLGTSPEFEIALYTLCFLCREVADAQGKIPLSVADMEFQVVVHDYNRGLNIGTAFPEA